MTVCDRLHCVIPPYMLDKVIERGTPRQRSWALRAIYQASQLRARRALVSAAPPWQLDRLVSGVDAHSAELVVRVYDAGGTESLPGLLVRSREVGEPGRDPVADRAYDGALQTGVYLRDVHRRNSIDDQGMVIDETVHYGTRFGNAFWNGSQMVFGDGDGEIFGDFTQDVDIIAHELTHGVTQYEAGLRYAYQSGALNEHFSDVFGSLVKQRSRGETAAQADWLIGDQVLLGARHALRSLKAPGTAYRRHPVLGDDPQPASMADYRALPPWDDNGGVHINSGIPNHAFYLAAIELGGCAWEKAGPIWYRALTQKLGADATFERAAEATQGAARELFGAQSLAERAVRRAWKKVGVV